MEVKPVLFKRQGQIWLCPFFSILGCRYFGKYLRYLLSCWNIWGIKMFRYSNHSLKKGWRFGKSRNYPERCKLDNLKGSPQIWDLCKSIKPDRSPHKTSSHYKLYQSSLKSKPFPHIQIQPSVWGEAKVFAGLGFRREMGNQGDPMRSSASLWPSVWGEAKVFPGLGFRGEISNHGDSMRSSTSFNPGVW